MSFVWVGFDVLDGVSGVGECILVGFFGWFGFLGFDR